MQQQLLMLLRVEKTIKAEISQLKTKDYKRSFKKCNFRKQFFFIDLYLIFLTIKISNGSF